MASSFRSQTFTRALWIAGAGAVLAGGAVVCASLAARWAQIGAAGVITSAAAIAAFSAFFAVLVVALRGSEIDRLNRRLNDLSQRDPLTNALNATTFAKAVGEYAERRRRIATDNGGVMISAVVGSFDELSRRYGLEWAETVMKSLTAIIQSSVRSGDLVARLSLNELGIFLPGAAAENAIDVAQRIRSRVASSTSSETDQAFSLKLGGTFFDGVAEFNTVRQLASEAAFDAADDEPIALARY